MARSHDSRDITLKRSAVRLMHKSSTTAFSAKGSYAVKVPICSHFAAQEEAGSMTVMMPWKLMVVQSSQRCRLCCMSRKRQFSHPSLKNCTSHTISKPATFSSRCSALPGEIGLRGRPAASNVRVEDNKRRRQKLAAPTLLPSATCWKVEPASPQAMQGGKKSTCPRAISQWQSATKRAGQYLIERLDELAYHAGHQRFAQGARRICIAV